MNGGSGDQVMDLSLRERMPDYLAIFGVSGAVAAFIGLVIALIAGSPAGVGAAYGLVTLGTIMLLSGGATGGGYASMGVGAFGAMFGDRNRMDEDVDDPEVRRGRFKRRDPYERLGKGLRPAANPRAFWMVVGGIAHFGLGAVLLAILQ